MSTTFAAPATISHPEIDDMVHDAIADFTKYLKGQTDAYSATIEEIEYRHVPGFIPFTDGGWNGEVSIGFYNEIGWAVPRIAKLLERDAIERDEAFRTEHELDDDADICEHPEYERWVDDWEQGDPTAWFLKVRAIFYSAGSARNETGEDEYLLCLGVNDDLGYGRDHVGAWAGDVGTHWIWEQTVPVSGINADSLEAIVGEMRQAWIDC